MKTASRLIFFLLLVLPASSLAQWEPTFVDNFDGSSLAINKWVRGQENLDRQLQSYRDEAIEVSNGTLKLKMLNQAYGGRPYTAGGVTTQGLFAQQYGYFEVRAKMPRGDGVWPAFWLMPVTGRWTSEIDILEYIGNQNKVHHAFHYDWKAQNQNGKSVGGFGDLAASFNVYGMEWDANSIRYTINGQLTHSINRRDVVAKADLPMYVMLNTALASQHTGWISNVSPETRFPQAFEVDYVRVFKRSATGAFNSIPNWNTPIPDTDNRSYDNVPLSIQSVDAQSTTPAINRARRAIRDTLRLTAHAPLEATLWISLHEATRLTSNGRYDSKNVQLIERPVSFSRAAETLDLSFEFNESLIKQPGVYHVDVVVRDKQTRHSNRSAARHKTYQFLNASQTKAHYFDAYIRSATATASGSQLSIDSTLQLQEALAVYAIQMNYEVLSVQGRVLHSASERLEHDSIGQIRVRHSLNLPFERSEAGKVRITASDPAQSVVSEPFVVSVTDGRAAPASPSIRIH